MLELRVLEPVDSVESRERDFVMDPTDEEGQGTLARSLCSLVAVIGLHCDNPPFGIRMVKTEDWSNINLVVESQVIKIDREILKNEVVEKVIVSEL